MLNSFEITKSIIDDYNYNSKLSDDLYFNYKNSDIFNAVEDGSNKIMLYGYCFDVQNPQKDVKDTLKRLLENSEDILEDIKYLNGHFVMLFNIDGSWKLITDAVSMTPVYVDRENSRVTVEDSEGLLTLSGLMVLNLQDFSISRIELPTNKLADERIERLILDYVVNQYEYFMDKDVTLNFRRNKMNKAIIATLHPVLINQILNLRENDELTERIGKWLSRDYKMQLLDNDTEPSTLYLANTHLMDYDSFMNRETGLSHEETAGFNSEYELTTEFLEMRSNVEYNLINNLRYRNEKKNHLIYDPFNVIAIQGIIYRYSDKKMFKPLSRIIKIIHPSIDFYDFSKGETLLQKYNKMKKQNKRLHEEMGKFKVNEEFLREAEQNGIKVSDNLDGTVQSDGITFYPANQNISKEDIFE